MARYLVRTPLRLNGHHFQPGEWLEMAPDQVLELVVSKVLEVVVESSDGLTCEPLQAAIKRLDPNQPDHWTRDNKPRIEALSQIMGRVVTAKERDRVWRTRESMS